MKVLACLCLVLGSLASVRAEQIGTEMTLQLIATFLANSVNNTIQYMLFGKDKFNMEEEVTFWCRTPSRSEYIQVLRTDPDITTKLDVTKGLALIVHGYTDNKDRSWMDKMAKAFAIYTDNNACLVDWHTFSNIEYSIAANTVNDVGKSVGDWLLYTAKFIPLNKTSIIGYSLGSHVAGAAGARTGGKLGAIWGSDPAHVMFTLPTPKPRTERLDKTDAQFVQVLHTTAGLYGTPFNLGHQDWYADGGNAYQKGCEPLDATNTTLVILGGSCSHSKANELIRHALNPANKFWNEAKTELFGYHSKRKAGTFIFPTSNLAPYTPE